MWDNLGMVLGTREFYDTSRWAWLKLQNMLLKLQNPILSMIQAFEWCIFVKKAFRLLFLRGVQHINKSIARLLYFH